MTDGKFDNHIYCNCTKNHPSDTRSVISRLIEDSVDSTSYKPYGEGLGGKGIEESNVFIISGQGDWDRIRKIIVKQESNDNVKITHPIHNSIYVHSHKSMLIRDMDNDLKVRYFPENDNYRISNSEKNEKSFALIKIQNPESDKLTGASIESVLAVVSDMIDREYPKDSEYYNDYANISDLIKTAVELCHSIKRDKLLKLEK